MPAPTPRRCMPASPTATPATYTTGSPPPPEGLQVGFIQGNSSISQTVTLPAGSYTLSLDAAQRATPQSPQSLNVLVDGMVVGTIQASGTTYQTESVSFTVAAGQHTITFQGTETSDSTELIDARLLDPRVVPAHAAAVARAESDPLPVGERGCDRLVHGHRVGLDRGLDLQPRPGAPGRGDDRPGHRPLHLDPDRPGPVLGDRPGDRRAALPRRATRRPSRSPSTTSLRPSN